MVNTPSFICILIDTGCGTGADYRAFVTSTINKTNLPYLVICTHVHFDHTGGNFRFSGTNAAGCKGILMGGADQTFSKNCSINSLCMAHNASIRDFQVTRWLNEGDLIHLDDANPTREEALEVIFTPGHTTDSIALYYPAEKKIFIDPFTAVHLDCIGSNVIQYLATLNKLIAFVDKQKAAAAPTPAPASASAPPAPAPAPAAPAVDPQVADFMAFTGIDDAAAKKFSITSLLELCDRNLERAVDMYLNSQEDVRQMCPPTASSSQGPPKAVAASTSGITLCCGHVEAALSPSALQEMLGVMAAIRAKAINPLRIDDGYGEYSYGNFTVMVSMKAKWE